MNSSSVTARKIRVLLAVYSKICQDRYTFSLQGGGGGGAGGGLQKLSYTAKPEHGYTAARIGPVSIPRVCLWLLWQFSDLSPPSTPIIHVGQ